ncbi:MAG: TolC family protein [Gammaproteobacteria bacterium]
MKVVKAPCLRRSNRDLPKCRTLIVNLFVLLAGAFSVTCKAADTDIADMDMLSLSQAEMLALQNDTTTRKARAQQESLKEKAVAAYSWPDPKLNLGIANVPPSFEIDQEPMTQMVVGITQMFPPWGAVGAKSAQLYSMSDAMDQQVNNRRLLTLAGVRKSWLDVYLQHQSLLLLQENLKVFKQFNEVARYQYRVGRGNQQDVIRAQLEQNLLEDRIAITEAKYESAVAVLTKWLGVERISKELDMQFPEFSDLPSEQRVLSNLEQHPTMRMRKMRVTAAENGVKYASSQRHPGWAFKVQYGYRADSPSGASRDDLITAMLTVDLPLFTDDRQDRLVSASKSDMVAAQQELDDWRRQIKMQFEKTMAVYTRANERVQLYQGSVLPHSKQNTEATLNAYQSGVTDFNVLVRARLTELKSELQFVKLNVERAKAQVELLYLAGVD